MEHVICATCQKAFPDAYSETQASGCASYYIAAKKAVFSHYGSSHDTSKFNVVAGDFKEGIICDGCIDTAIENKQIVVDETFDYWETVRKMQQKQIEARTFNWKILNSL